MIWRDRARYEAHLLVVLLLMIAALVPSLPRPVFAHAATAAPAPSRSEVQVLSAFARGHLSVREERSPRPLPDPLPPREDFSSYVVPPPAPAAATPAPPAPAPLRSAGGVAWPLRGPITTYFSAWHQAIDIGAACGTPVRAPFAGAVTWAGWRDNGGGNVLELSSGPMLASLNHLQGFVVTSGTVAQGQVVAYSGTTGNSTGCHLHFQLVVGGLSVDPLLYLP